MANFNWNDMPHANPVSQDAKPFSWDDMADDNVEPKTSAVTAGATGLIQSAVPFASALAGAGRAGMNAITGVTGPLAGGSMSDIADDYRGARDQFVNDTKTAEKAHPGASFAGNLAGGFANPLFKAASLPGMLGAGAVQALGQSDVDLTQPNSHSLKDLGKDALAGVAGAGMGYGVGKAIAPLAGALGKGTKKFLTALGPSEEAINARLAGNAQDNSPNYSHIADSMSETLKGLKDQIASKAKIATETLSTEPSIPRPYVTAALEKAKGDLHIQGQLLGPTDKAAANTIDGFKEDLQKLPEQLSERDLKTLIQKMDDNINWADQSKDKENNILKGLRSSFDQTLKFQNPQYKEAMEPVAARLGLLNDLQKRFNFKHVPGEGLQPTDTTATKLQTSLRDNKAVTQDSLDQLKGFTGDDFSQKAKDFQLANQFENTGPNGSRRTVLGGAIGGALGHMAVPGIGTTMGSAIGAGVGATLDRYGGQAAGKLIDAYVKAGNTAALGKFAPAIREAAAQGPQALAVTGSVLSQNPEFRKLIGLEQPPQ